MKALVVYDSNYGNTKLIAEVVAKELKAKAKNASEIDLEADLDNLDLLIVGSPINSWRPTEKITIFLKKIPEGELRDVCAAAFDTRVRLFIHGDAASKIANGLKKVGATIIAKPEGFTVLGTEGPLTEGELDRAKEWANSLKSNL